MVLTGPVAPDALSEVVQRCREVGAVGADEGQATLTNVHDLVLVYRSQRKLDQPKSEVFAPGRVARRWLGSVRRRTSFSPVARTKTTSKSDSVEAVKTAQWCGAAFCTTGPLRVHLYRFRPGGFRS